jgi:hypothetical protein
MTTYASLVEDLAGMSVTGLVRAYTAPPGNVNSADLPALWPMLPEGDNEAPAFGGTADRRTMTVELWCAVKPSAHASSAERYAALTPIMEALHDALCDLNGAAAYALEWRLRGGVLGWGGMDYVGVIASVTATVIEG